jgi:hypothetical protein
MAESQITKVQKLTRNGNFRACAMQLRAWLSTVEGHDEYFDREPADDDDRAIDRQAKANLIL